VELRDAHVSADDAFSSKSVALLAAAPAERSAPQRLAL
jgi:hypothetical protein